LSRWKAGKYWNTRPKVMYLRHRIGFCSLTNQSCNSIFTLPRQKSWFGALRHFFIMHYAFVRHFFIMYMWQFFLLFYFTGNLHLHIHYLCGVFFVLFLVSLYLIKFGCSYHFLGNKFNFISKKKCNLIMMAKLFVVFSFLFCARLMRPLNPIKARINGFGWSVY
jgi:hypothetical protein